MDNRPYLASAPYAAPYASPYAAPYAYAGHRFPYAGYAAAPFYNYAPSFYHNYFPAARAFVAAPAAAGVKTVASPVARVSSVSSPLPVPKSISPITTHLGQHIATPLGTLTPHDCVTEAGCLVRTLKGAGLAKRSAESDPQLIAAAPGFAPYALSPYAPFAANYYSGAAAFPYAAHAALPYAHYANYAYAAPTYATVPAPAPAPAVAVAAPEVAVEVAAPAPVVTPVVRALPAVAPAPVPVPVPVVRQAYRVPVVENISRKVTYTHLGAHPIHPTDVIETDSRVVGEQIVF